jgi:protease-4
MAETETWQRQLIEKLLLETLYEQRRVRRWRLFFRLLVLVLVVGGMVALLEDEDMLKGIKDHTALVELEGAIASDTRANADDLGQALREAFEDTHTKAVILRINSPGGSPVQSGYLYDEIRRLRAKYPKIPLYAVVTDICASGGYYIASAADAIYADKASLVGSIGAIMGGFGFVGALEKLGIERRVVAAGEHKALLDPFAPLKEEERQYVQKMLAEIHAQFIQAVRQGRGDRLKEDAQTFSGLIWTGDAALKLGLIDGLGSADYVAREIVKVDNLVEFSSTRDLAARLVERFGVSLGQGLTALTGAPVLR